jgi:DNA-binding NarL/FixJ family response regulator
MQKTVLVVEDDDSIADFLEVTLESRGFKVRRASDGLQALTLFSQYPPDVVLLDRFSKVLSALFPPSDSLSSSLFAQMESTIKHSKLLASKPLDKNSTGQDFREAV